MTFVSSHRLARSAAAGLATILAAAMFVAPVAASSTGTLYVSSEHGNDVNTCSHDQPCLTIGHALAMAAPGATVRVDEGTYHEQVSITSRVTLEGEDAVIDATGQKGGIQPLAGMGVVGYGLLVFGPGARGSVVKGFTIQHAIGEGILVAGTSGILIENNHLRWNDAGFNTNLTLECQAQGNIPGDCGEGLHFLSVTWSRALHNVVEHNVGHPGHRRGRPQRPQHDRVQRCPLEPRRLRHHAALSQRERNGRSVAGRRLRQRGHP